MTSKEYRPLKTNACSKVGRPQKYSEKWRSEIGELEPDTPGQFLTKLYNWVRDKGGSA